MVDVYISRTEYLSSAARVSVSLSGNKEVKMYCGIKKVKLD
jgi:hypothetical protein